MASVYDLKPAFQRRLRPLVGALARAGVTANQVTVGAAGLSIAAGGAIGLGAARPGVLLLLPVVLFVRMALNAIDGMLAREFGQKSALGGILNEVGDVVSDAALYLPLALVPGFSPALVATVVALAGVTEVAGIAAAVVGASRRYDGPMGKSDRALVFGTLGLALALGAPREPWLSWLLWAVVALLVLTTLNRVRRAVAELARA
jgi:CDP-diacylglycerol--glycerol-3-phosphate 3-phosphatidyltransferase